MRAFATMCCATLMLSCGGSSSSPDAAGDGAGTSCGAIPFNQVLCPADLGCIHSPVTCPGVCAKHGCVMCKQGEWKYQAVDCAGLDSGADDAAEPDLS